MCVIKSWENSFKLIIFFLGNFKLIIYVRFDISMNIEILTYALFTIDTLQ